MKAFDPKWSYVQSLWRFGNAIAVYDEKTNNPATLTGVAIVKDNDAFQPGAIYFQDQEIPRYVATGLTSFNFPILVEVSFLLTEWSGVDTCNGIFDFGSCVQFSIYQHTRQLLARIRPNTTQGWAGALYYDIPDVDQFVGVKHDVRVLYTATSIALELDGLVVATSAHLSASSPAAVYGVLGNYYNAILKSYNFVGWVGPIRVTTGDARPEDRGAPIEKFPTLDAVDPFREKVIFHSHCEPTASGVLEDNCGNSIDMRGNVITTAYKRFGAGSISIIRSLKIGPNPDFILGRRDFALEFSVSRAPNSYFQFFYILNESGNFAISLRGRAGSGPGGYLIINGVENSFGRQPVYINGRCAVCRMGNWLRVFANAAAPIFSLDIGNTEIGGDGYLYLGTHPDGGLPGTTPCIDEIRLTVGINRYPSGQLPGGPLADPFSDFGPRSFSGRVEDKSGSPLQRRVRCHHRRFGNLISETLSAADGSFTLPAGDIDEHYIVVLDDEENAIIYDRVMPEIMT